MSIQIRRGLEADLPAAADEGQPLFSTDTHKLWIGTGAGTAAISTPPGGSNGDLQYNNSSVLGGFADGTSSQLLHGGKTFGAVDLATEVGSSKLPLANGGTNADLSVSGSATAVLAQDASHVITARALIGADIPAIDLAASGAGGVTGLLPPANAGVASIVTAGQGYFWGPGMFNLGFAATASNTPFSTSQFVRCVQFVLPFRITSGHISWIIATTKTGSWNAGIYSADGTTKLLDSGAMNTGVGTAQTAAVGPVTLDPGVYYFAYSATDNTTALFTINPITNVVTTLNKNYHRMGVTNQSTSGGVMPSGLSLSSGFSDTVVNVPLPIFER